MVIGFVLRAVVFLKKPINNLMLAQQVARIS
jgi:hypothetical protein